MQRLLIILATMWLPLCTPDDKPDGTVAPHVVGGKPAKRGQFPFVVSLRNGDENFCGGSIISPRWILTAASCLYRVDEMRTRILAGSIYQCKGGTEYEVKQKVQHPDFTGRDEASYKKHDIGVIKTLTKIRFSKYIQPIKLAHASTGTKVVVLGWGNNRCGDVKSILEFAQMRAVDTEACAQYIPDIYQEQACTFAKAGVGICRGDRGGPLMSQCGKLVGIVSYGKKWCTRKAPDVHTRTVAYISWIEKVTHLPSLYLLSD